jgi:hypothetical protein
MRLQRAESEKWKREKNNTILYASVSWEISLPYHMLCVLALETKRRTSSKSVSGLSWVYWVKTGAGESSIHTLS